MATTSPRSRGRSGSSSRVDGDKDGEDVELKGHKRSISLGVSTGPSQPQALKRKKQNRVLIVPDTLQSMAAVRELRKVKRSRVVGQKWNSATIFSIMWGLYILGLVMYFSADPQLCFAWVLFLGLRVVLLLPTTILAILWQRGWWPERAPDPEWIGIMIALYISVIVTIKFTTNSNVDCNSKFVSGLNDNDVKVRIEDTSGLSNLSYYYRRGDCDVFYTDSSSVKYADGCIAEIEDVRSEFEINVHAWIGQLILYLFGITSLFKPSFKATMVYNCCMIMVVLLGCFLQPQSFWSDTDRVQESEISNAIFVFLGAVLVNVYSAYILYNMERELVHANYALLANMEKRQRGPSGDKVVYLETDLQSSTKLWDKYTEVMHRAIKTHHSLMRTLALEYSGWELSTEGDAFLLAFHDVFDAVSMALTFQAEMMEQDWPADLLQDNDACAETMSLPTTRTSSVSGGGMDESVDTRMNLSVRTRTSLAAARGKSVSRQPPALRVFNGPRVRMAIHMGPGDQNVKGPTTRFVHHLTDCAWGGMVLLSEPVAQELMGVLDQLDHTAQAKRRDRKERVVEPPKLVAMGLHTFEECDKPMELYHMFSSPLRARHLRWGDNRLKLRDSIQHTLGFYDTPVQREGIPEPATIIFADIDNGITIRRQNPEAFASGLRIIENVINPVLLTHGGYQVPQREGHYMFVFSSPVDAARFHAGVQVGLMDADWGPEHLDVFEGMRGDFMHGSARPRPSATGKLSLATPRVSSTKNSRSNLYRGYVMSFGMSIGYVNKVLEKGRANFLGPTCNRAARISGYARQGQLLMAENEFQIDRTALYSTAPADGSPGYPITGHLLYENQTLKGITGNVNIVWLDTCELVKLRQVPEPMQNT